MWYLTAISLFQLYYTTIYVLQPYTTTYRQRLQKRRMLSSHLRKGETQVVEKLNYGPQQPTDPPVGIVFSQQKGNLAKVLE